VIGWVHIRLGEILYEWNDIDAARKHLDQGRERAEFGGEPRAIIAGGILVARILLAQGEIASAEATLEQVRPEIESAQFPEWSGQFDRCQVRLWLAQNTLGSAIAWSDAMLASDALSRPEHEHTELAIAHVLLATSTVESSDRAVALLDRLSDSARAEGKTGIQIEALALRSLARWARGDHANALTSLEHALRLAEPEGYVRTFVDSGLPLAKVLQEARARHVMPEYVGKLLAGFEGAALPSGQASSHLAEPLSQRELEVLRNIAAGLTNREIAEVLFISPETVKKHTSSIYGRLGARSRMEAVAISRELKLLD
jgi:LuxR family maltose regulon positive regulatory protein